MTAHRDLKRIIRERQKKTRESYTAARAHVLRDRAALLGLDADPPATTGVVLKVSRRSARVRILGEKDQVTFRPGEVWDVVPGHLVTLVVDRRWTWRGDAYASGRIEGPRIEVAKLGLEPLALDGGELEDVGSYSEPYRDPDPYAAGTGRAWRRWRRPCGSPRRGLSPAPGAGLPLRARAASRRPRELADSSLPRLPSAKLVPFPVSQEPRCL